MNAHFSRKLLTASGLLLAMAFAPVHCPAQYMMSKIQASPAPKAAPDLPVSNNPAGPPIPTRHVIALLINATQLAPGTEALDQKIADAFDLKVDTAVLPLGPAPAGFTPADAEHFFAVPRISDRKQVVILHRLEDGSTEAFLCDYSGRLRAAVVVAADGTVRKVGIWRAAGKFQAELSAVGNEVMANGRRYVQLIASGK